jgi:hypothetical protein
MEWPQCRYSRCSFGSLDFSCVRDMAQGFYILSSRDHRCAISPDDASRLAGARALLQWRGRVAVAKNLPMKAGAVFKRTWASFTVEIGITVAGDTVYVQVGELRANLEDGDGRARSARGRCQRTSSCNGGEGRRLGRRTRNARGMGRAVAKVGAGV